MDQWTLAQTIRLAAISKIMLTEDEDVIWEHLRCPDCGGAQHDFDPEEVDKMVEDAESLEHFVAIYEAASEALHNDYNTTH
jgi:hypothetical protein